MHSEFIYTDGVKPDCIMMYKPVEYALTNGKIITIPRGFESDFASIPRGFGLWDIFPPHYAPYRHASIVHDYLYMDQNIITSRPFADMEFKRILLRYNVHPVIAFIFWACVRLGGGGRWKKYKKAKDKSNDNN